MGRARGPRRRVFAIGVVALAFVGVFGGGWAIATAVESPAQRAAAARPPASRPVEAKITKGDLADEISSTVTIQRQDREQISFDFETTPSVVTKRSAPPGSSLTAGEALLEVNGRPIIALPGVFPFYRDLTPGMVGPDVAQLQSALSAAGYPVGSDGSFGDQTTAAVTALYRHLGYSVPSTESSTPDESRADQPSASSPPAAQTPSSAPPAGAVPAGPTLITVPRTELTVVAASPSFIVDSPSVGTVITTESRAVIERGSRQALAPIPVAAAARVRTGMTGTITTSTGESHPVTVVSVAKGTAEKDSVVRLSGSTAEIPTRFGSGRILLRLDVQIVAKDSLLVPTRAVVTGGAGRSHVQVARPDGSFLSVEVDELGQFDGRSAIAPSKRGELTAGQFVRVR